ncbi:hypothetical protein GQ43DRAFT_90178 [Delitschia confertaspora ATCC 74209]|uniref:NACHT domain-containing protein n=1 Tax=Delitschia confertaspora ATCC 74209 TaxID=1513339 RepID=A0A9P4JJ14_9PLEO|nr:hypothetical protein GQ43DRAFT_90178 [Delitschia confertaspora ATCC 74209]
MAHPARPALPQLDWGQPTTSKLEVDKLFNDAKSSFLETLTPQERDQFTGCSSADQLLCDIRTLENLPKSRRALPFMRKIKGFSDFLSPYFKVIEIVFQSNPEWSCIAWGAFRLVLQLASNFTTFFEKLSKLIEKLTATLPQYAEFYQTLCSGDRSFSPRLSNSLVRFYVDMLEFFQAVARVFSRPNGKLKRSPTVIADLLWRPFDLRFEDILERMKFHQGVLRDELNWAGMEKLRLMFEKEAKRAEDKRAEARRHEKLSETIRNTLSDEAQRNFRASIVTWLAPPSFKDNFETAQDSREEGTAEWLFDEPKFKAWVSSTAESISSRVLWIRGNPGWGKTVVAASTIEELESNRSESGQEPIVCYYFFNRQDSLKDSSTPLAAYRAIALQIFQKCHTIEEIHSIYGLANDGSKSSASEHELRDLLGMVIPLLSDLYLVLDGLDECAGVAKLINDIRDFCSLSPSKAILFSRPHVAPLRRFFGPEQIITMCQNVMSDDIQVFVHHQVEILRDKGCFPFNADLLSIEGKIVGQADGMFLWARLMIYYLDSPALTKSERMSTIFKTTPVGLQQMYDKILSQIALMDDASRKLASSVFTWITYAQDELTAEECSDAVYPAVGTDDASEKKNYVDNAVIVVCCGLVEKRQNSTLRFIHLTAKDHLLSLATRGREMFTSPVLEAHIEIATRCLSYLLFSVPAQPLSGNPSTSASPKVLCCQYPLLRYAATHWAKHLQDGFTALMDGNASLTGLEKLRGAIDMLIKFLDFPLNVMVWIEAVYLFNKGPFISSIGSILDLLRGSLEASSDPGIFKAADNFSSFVHDLQEINGDWKDTLEDSPHEIWGDIPSFTTSRFLAQNRGISMEILAPSEQDHSRKCTHPIFCIASQNSDCSLIGKLTIYPSSIFHRLWKTNHLSYDKNWQQRFFGDDNDYQRYCEGWIAQYDIHRLGEKSEKVFSKTITLASEEIALQMQFSLRLSPVRCWKLKFPLAISPDLSAISILRTITTFDPWNLQEDGLQQYFSIIPALNHCELFRRSWSRKDVFSELPYIYEWLFTSNNRFAVFRDWDMEQNYGSFAIFRLIRCLSGLESALFMYHRFDGRIDQEGLRICAIHPFKARLMLLDQNKLFFMDLETAFH